jgi:two-component system OmpR family response regulator
MSKILLIEDDPEMAKTIMSWLNGERHQMTHCANAVEGLEFLLSGAFEVVIIDWQLPGMDGTEVIRRYRATGGSLPIIMLTGKDAVNDRITGLDSGADDYLTKPFSLKELSARIRAMLRRPSGISGDVLKVGDLTLDPVKYRVSKRGVEVQLMPRDFALLEFFMRNVDAVFSSETLLQRVWQDDTAASSDAVRTAVKRLRRKLDDGEDESQSMIENIPRVGYRLRVPTI